MEHRKRIIEFNKGDVCYYVPRYGRPRRVLVLEVEPAKPKYGAQSYKVYGMDNKTVFPVAFSQYLWDLEDWERVEKARKKRQAGKMKKAKEDLMERMVESIEEAFFDEMVDTLVFDDPNSIGSLSISRAEYNEHKKKMMARSTAATWWQAGRQEDDWILTKRVYSDPPDDPEPPEKT